MKHFYTFSLVIGLASGATAQTVSTFEETTLPDSSYYNGSDGAGGFSSGNAFFNNDYDFGFWLGGWALSNITDTVTQPSDFSTQLYSAREVSGAAGSQQFAIGTSGSYVTLTGVAAGKSISGFFITNSSYAYNSMKLGDSFAKKFGGATGNDPDYFRLLIKKFQGGTLAADSVEFFLADYRFTDNSQDYIVDEWTWVDLSPLGNADSLMFALSSSDVGSFGMNTPAYFCIDHFTTNDSPTGIAAVPAIQQLNLYPNPAASFLYVNGAQSSWTYTIFAVDGKQISTGLMGNTRGIDVSVLPAGVYVLQVNGYTAKFVKE